jgi:hypothetical protein
MGRRWKSGHKFPVGNALMNDNFMRKVQRTWLMWRPHATRNPSLSHCWIHVLCPQWAFVWEKGALYNRRQTVRPLWIAVTADPLTASVKSSSITKWSDPNVKGNWDITANGVQLSVSMRTRRSLLCVEEMTYLASNPRASRVIQNRENILGDFVDIICTSENCAQIWSQLYNN